MNEFKRIREKIEELEYHKNDDSITDRGLELLTELHQALQLQQTGVIGSYSEKDMDNAYDKGFKDAMIKYRTDL